MSSERQPAAPPGYEVTVSPAVAERLQRINALKAAVEAAKAAHPELWPTVFHKLKLEWTTDSNAIEGSSLTFADTKFFIEQGLTVQGKPLKDFLDARNHHQAIDIALDLVRHARPITEGALKELNALVLQGVASVPSVDARGHQVEKPIRPGAYKREPNSIFKPDKTVHRYVDPVRVPEEMEHLVTFVEGGSTTVHPAIAAALAHYPLVRIHPFDDGNGRCARLLMNLMLLRAGYPPCVIRNEDRAAYLAALDQADRGDFEPFLGAVLSALEDTCRRIEVDLQS